MSRSLLLRLVSLLLVLVLCAIAYQSTNSMDEARQLIWRIPIFVIGAGVLGVMGVLFFLPAMADRMAQWFYSAPEKVEPDAGSKGRALIAMGDYAGATDAFLEQAKQMPTDRLPVVEAMRLAREKLRDPARAVAIVKEAIETRDWPEDDAAYFLFRLVELHDDELQDAATASAYLQEVITRFPGTRHAANAAHKLRERGIEPVMPEVES
jgi:tetratricopeptide (TPR) repeat protein